MVDRDQTRRDAEDWLRSQGQFRSRKSCDFARICLALLSELEEAEQRIGKLEAACDALEMFLNEKKVQLNQAVEALRWYAKESSAPGRARDVFAVWEQDT